MVSGARASMELRFQHADGTWRWFELRGQNLLDDPTIGGVVSNLRDINDRKQAEERLRLSEERFRALVQNASDVVQIMDAAGVVTWVSPGVKAMLGYEPDELDRSAGRLHRAPRRRAASSSRSSISPRVGSTARSASRTGCATRTARGDGSTAWWPTTWTSRAVEGIVANYRDITERKLAEEALRDSEVRFRSVTAGSPIGIYEMDSTPVLRFVNERWVGDHRLRRGRRARPQLAGDHPPRRPEDARRTSGRRPVASGNRSAACCAWSDPTATSDG